MSADRGSTNNPEIDALVDRLREEIDASRGGVDGSDKLRARRELDRLWAVTAERPNLYRPGTWGRVRGTLLVPPKALLRRLLRWYVEPLATDQRAFNAGVVRLADELAARMAQLDERIARLEAGDSTSERASS